MVTADETSRAFAGNPPSESINQQIGPLEASDSMLTIEALKVRVLLMLAAPQGGPIASGLRSLVARANITHQLIADIVAAVEKAFTEHGEKALRANCADKLAKDESYGFLCADLILGTIIPREKAIPLGQKLRKENTKIKKKRDGFRDGRSRALSKLPEVEREAAGRVWDLQSAAYLAAPCAADLPIPS